MGRGFRLVKRYEKQKKKIQKIIYITLKFKGRCFLVFFILGIKQDLKIKFLRGFVVIMEMYWMAGWVLGWPLLFIESITLKSKKSVSVIENS